MTGLFGELAELCQCMLGLKSPSGLALKKKTKLKSNIPAVIHAFQGLMCDKSHKHGSVSGSELGSVASKWLQQYPALMCKIMAGAIEEHLCSQGR